MFPAAIDAPVGVTLIEMSTAGVTVNVTPGEVTPFCEAVIVVGPVEIPVAIPAALIVAIEAFEEFQVTLFVKFCVV